MTLGFLVLAVAQVMVAVPAAPPPAGTSPLERPADPATLTLVVADSVDQTDPRPLCAEPRCTSLFLTTWKNARTISGEPLGEALAARMVMGSPFMSPNRVALVIEHRDGKEPLVRAARGFNDRTGEACFQSGEWDAVGPAWRPEAPAIAWHPTYPCVKE